VKWARGNEPFEGPALRLVPVLSAIRLRAVAGPARGLRIAKPQARLKYPPSHPLAACKLALWALGAALTLGAVILRLGDA